jgi:hypothetical protein
VATAAVPPSDFFVGCTGFHRHADHPFGDLVEVTAQLFVCALKVRPERLVDEALGHTHHDRRPALRAIAIRFQLVAAQNREEQPLTPPVREREPVLDRRIAALELAQATEDSLARRSRGDALALRRCAGKQRLEIPQLLQQLVLVHDRTLPLAVWSVQAPTRAPRNVLVRFGVRRSARELPTLASVVGRT